MPTNLADKQTLTALRIDMEAAFATIAAKHGIELRATSITYGPDGSYADIKVKAVVKSEDGLGGKETAAYKRSAFLVGCKPEWLGQSVTVNGTTGNITGMKPGNKFDIMVRLGDGRMVGYNHATIIKAMTS